ncbi:MAG: sigma 54-interacting transcriptional regulator [Clostridiales Family XIII bacterium]|nr:sigma 54-interacting transcriptional regulator [Clostridia bacterium]MDY3010552.1 sigma 54-interacting transcriptional regulator [Clostridiales Family XIII bacterium]
MDYSVAIILPNTLTYNTTKEVLKELNLDYPLYKATEHDAVSIANDLIARGTRIIISTGLAYQYLKREVSISLLEMPFSGLEAAIAAKKALSYSNRIVHIGTAPLFHYLQKGLEFLGVEQNCIRFCELDMEKTIEEQTLDMLSEALQQNHVVDIDTVTPDQLEDPSQYTLVILNKLPVIVHGEEQGSVISVKKVSEIQELRHKTRKHLYVQGLWAEHYFADIKGTSKAITAAKEKAEIYAKYDSAVLISGETGTGKELFAQSIHNTSRRKTQPWVPVNCASLPENLIESELFGYAKGAFTGANKEGKMGFFELADGGTIFLDEISEIPITTQSKLLRVIQEGDVIRVGGDKIIHVDIRVICSSNKNLLQLIREGKFKEDLYYRLCVLELKLPPLRERKEDIKDLAYALLNKFNHQHDKYITSIAPQALQVLENLPLYGNVRELSNIIERTVILCEKSSIDETFLRETIDSSALTAAPISAASSGKLKDLQKEVILSTLEQCGGNKAAAARALGIDPSTLWRKMKKYELT